MSAIWGIVDFKGNEINTYDKKRMSESYSACRIDKIQDINRADFYMASGIQYITVEATQEQFPYTYIDNKVMVADAIIDNRKEIISEFTLKNELSLKGVDGSILYEITAKSIMQALDRLCGAFVFAEYEEKEKKIYIANDAVGNRSIYYLYNNGRFVFSSLLKPLVPYLDKIEVEEEWLKQFIDNEDLLIVNSPSLTPYKNIYRLEPGEMLEVTEKGIQHNRYWNPYKKNKKLKFKTDDEYKTIVIDTFKKCVESVIREPGETGLLLSGGLDSNAVAAFAAPYLKKKGKKLISYTSVPNDKIEPIPKKEYYVSNERIYVEKLKQYHDNLEPHFIDVSKIDIVPEFENVSKEIETPIKTVVNAPWIHNAFRQAKTDGCNILLGGQYGNITISYGMINNLFASLKHSGRLISLVKAVSTYGKAFKVNRKRVMRNALKEKKVYSIKQSRIFMYDKKALRQVGESELHESLISGVIFRDPTRDRRLIELVISLPIEQFVNPYTDRRLVREYMKDVIPYEIVSERFHKGSQGDAGYDTIRTKWTEIKEGLKAKYNSNMGKKFLSNKNLCDWVDHIDEKDTINEFDMIKAIYLGSLCEYLEEMANGK